MATLLVALASPLAAAPTPSPTWKAAIVVEPSTGTVLHAENAYEPLPTASMIKMLNALVLMDLIEEGWVDWDTPIRANREIAWTEGSQVYLKEGEVFPVRELLAATMIKSANDAAVALAIGTVGSQDAYVALMRRKARDLGIRDGEIHTPCGLPPEETGRGVDRLSAWALARIGSEVMRYPELMDLAGTKLRWFRDGEFQLYNSNHLLRRYEHATGIKTGYTRSARFGLTASAHRDGMDLVAVVMGAEKQDSFNGPKRLFEEAFARYELVVPVAQGQPLPGRVGVRDGARPAVTAMVAEEVRWVAERGTPEARPEVAIVSRQPRAPVLPGEPVATVVIHRPGGGVLASVPAVAAERVPEASPWRQAKNRFLGVLNAALTGR